jgi:hypothetical protein
VCGWQSKLVSARCQPAKSAALVKAVCALSADMAQHRVEEELCTVPEYLSRTRTSGQQQQCGAVTSPERATSEENKGVNCKGLTQLSLGS